MSRIDIDSFLQQGYWPNSRVRSPDPRSRTRVLDNLHPSFLADPAPEQTLVFRDPSAPRWLPSTVARPQQNRPPATVEDEVDSLAKEHGSPKSSQTADEAPNRGAWDQYPIVLEVHEHNPERRFVLVPISPDEDDSATQKTPTSKRDSSHGLPDTPTRQKPRETTPEANNETKPEHAVPSESRTKPELRSSPPQNHPYPRDSLPPIVTDVAPEPPLHNVPRPKSSMGLKTGPSDYHSPREREGSNLSPDVPRSATKTRDRSERRLEEPGDGMYERRTRPQEETYARKAPLGPRYRAESRSDSLRPTPPVHPSLEKRHSANDINASKTKPRPRESPERRYAGFENVDRSPTKPSGKRTSRDSSLEGPFEYKAGHEPQSSRDWDTSEEDSTRRGDGRRRQKPIIVDERLDRSGFVGPRPETRAPVDKGRYRARDVNPARRSQPQLFENDPVGTRSYTLPQESRSSDDERQRPPIPPTRASTTRGSMAPSPSVAMPTIVATATAASAAHNREFAPSVDKWNTGVLPPPSLYGFARSSAPTLSSSPPKQIYQPSRFDPALNGFALDRPIPHYRRLSEDVRNGELPDIADCPRTIETAGHMDWLTLPRCDNFNICPTCFQNVFADTDFATSFTLAPFRPADRPIKCDFGTSQWFHIAWLLILKYRHADMTLMHNIATVGAKTQACSGFRETYRRWYSIKEPGSSRTISSFRICSHCAKTTEVLLPNLTGVFVEASAEPSTGVCLMHPSPERRRFLLYFDIMETASDRALATKSAPDIRRLAAKIRELSRLPECRGHTLVQDNRWHIMKKLPNFTVCEECFEDVIQPLLDRGQALSFVGNFHSNPVQLQLGACQLYSDRMREIFGKAMRRKDFDYLEEKLEERKDKEREMHRRLAGLDREALGAEFTEQEITRIMEEWKGWE
ncbi:hypothetical protein MN608_05780 [Microdochium nivale]|nr:hypothetical protein MN608_05780 [Microdochium nivale]